LSSGFVVNVRLFLSMVPSSKHVNALGWRGAPLGEREAIRDRGGTQLRRSRRTLLCAGGCKDSAACTDATIHNNKTDRLDSRRQFLPVETPKSASIAPKFHASPSASAHAVVMLLEKLLQFVGKSGQRAERCSLRARAGEVPGGRADGILTSITSIELLIASPSLVWSGHGEDQLVLQVPRYYRRVSMACVSAHQSRSLDTTLVRYAVRVHARCVDPSDVRRRCCRGCD
jgi:hypothetical protein